MFPIYPYLNINDLNLDYLLRTVRVLETEIKNFVNFNKIKYADPLAWNITTQYEGNTVVIDSNSGIAYLSTQAVPNGVAITNTNYWTAIFDMSTFFAEIGNLNDLETVAKNTLVAAINELFEKIDVIQSNRIITASDYPGNNDAEILQAAIDDAIANKYDTIVINREFDITGHTLNIDKGYYYTDSNYYRYRSKLTFMGVNGAKIKKLDSGFFFSATIRSGDIAFINITFEGDVHDLGPGYDDIASKQAGNSVFDCSQLIRIFTTQCSYILVGKVFDGRNTTSSSNAMQSIFSSQDLMTYSDTMFFINLSWDIHVNGALIENSNNLLKVNHSTSSVALTGTFIENSDIEGAALNVIDCDDTGAGYAPVSIVGMRIRDCYFEADGSVYINLNSSYLYGVTIDGNRFSVADNSKGVIINQRNRGSFVTNNSYSGNSGSYFIDVQHNGTVSYRYLTTFGNFGTGSMAFAVDLDEISDLENEAITTYTNAASYGSGGLSDANNLTENCVIHLNNETVTNTPATKGLLLSLGASTNRIQLFFAPTTAYERIRISGIGWTAWKEFSLS